MATTSPPITGTDPGGNVVVTLDLTGRITEVHVSDLATEGGRRGLERAFVAAAGAAFDNAQQARADLVAAAGDPRAALSDLTAQLREISARAGAQLTHFIERVDAAADRAAGR